MSALKPRKFSSDEEQQEKIQYVVVQHSSQIKKILKAEKETPIIQTSQDPTPVIPTEQKSKTQEKTTKARQFIKDDRHREYPKFKEEEKRQTNFKQQYQSKKEENKYQKNEKKQELSKEAPKRRNQRYQYRERAQQSQKEQKKQNNQEGKKKFVEKSQSTNYKEEKFSEKTQKSTNKNANYKQQQKTTTVRQQYQYINGEEITIELIQNRCEHENVIFIGEKLAKDYVKRAKKLINQEDTIIIKAFGLFVSKAFLVAGLLADVTPGLKQINNPSTVSVLQFSKKSEVKTKRGMIEIELSLNSLNKKNFGYQEQPLQPKQSESKSNKGRDRPQERRAYKQKEEIDERELR